MKLFRILAKINEQFPVKTQHCTDSGILTEFEDDEVFFIDALSTYCQIPGIQDVETYTEDQ